MKLSYGDKCNIARNKNMIKELKTLKARCIRNTNESIKALKKENRKIKWGDKLWDK